MIRVNIIKDELIIKSVYKDVKDGILMAWAQENAVNPGYAIFSDVGELIDTQDGQGEVLAIDIFAKTIKVSLKGAVVPVIYTLEEFQSHG